MQLYGVRDDQREILSKCMKYIQRVKMIYFCRYLKVILCLLFFALYLSVLCIKNTTNFSCRSSLVHGPCIYKIISSVCKNTFSFSSSICLPSCFFNCFACIDGVSINVLFLNFIEILGLPSISMMLAVSYFNKLNYVEICVQFFL